jgi:hypothetical protein
VRVNSDNQTLILAGEAIPRRAVASPSARDLGLARIGRPLTIVATLADDTRLLTHGDFARKTSAAVGDGENTLLPSSYLSSTLGASFTAANEYARTQNLSGSGIRTAIIDTYA